MSNYKKQHRLLTQRIDSMAIAAEFKERQRQKSLEHQEAKINAIMVLREGIRDLLDKTLEPTKAKNYGSALERIYSEHPTASLALEVVKQYLTSKGVDLQSDIWVEGLKKLETSIVVNPNDYQVRPI